MDSSLKYNCVFGGGGIRGMCYIGAIQAIDEFGFKIDKVAGSSVGAVFVAHTVDCRACFACSKAYYGWRCRILCFSAW